MGEARHFKFCVLIDTEGYEWMHDDIVLHPERVILDSRDL